MTSTRTHFLNSRNTAPATTADPYHPRLGYAVWLLVVVGLAVQPPFPKEDNECPVIPSIVSTIASNVPSVSVAA